MYLYTYIYKISKTVQH